MLTPKALQQTITELFFPKEKGKHVFVWGDIDTSQRSKNLTSGTVCYVNIDRIDNKGLPRMKGSVYLKDCTAYVSLRFVGVDSFKLAEQASFMVQNRKASKLFREMGAEILAVTGVSSIPFVMAETNITYCQMVTIRLFYTMAIETDADKLSNAELHGGIKVEEPTR